jgi:hypothetical protein
MKLVRRLLSLLPRSLRDRVIRSQMKIDESEIRDLEVKVAATVKEHEAAARLVHDTYVARGILRPHASGVRVTPYTLLPTSVVFVAKQGEEVVGTLSLICDSPMGLPMESIYGAEVQALRDQGRLPAEVGALCVSEHHRGAGVVYLLNRIMADTARLLGVDDLVIAVHPGAEDLYRAALLFGRIGDLKHYPGLERSALAVALRLDLKDSRQRYSEVFGRQGRDCANPHWLYFERQNPQIAGMETCAFTLADELLRRRATRRLSALAPDAFVDLSGARARQLFILAPGVRMPRPVVQKAAAA